MKRFTVSLPDPLYDRLLERCRRGEPPATLQQMLRLAVERVLDAGDVGDGVPDDADDAPDGSSGDDRVEPGDLLVFGIGDSTYGLPIGAVESVSSELDIHRVPTADPHLLGVALLRGALVEVVDGGTAVGTTPVDGTRLLAIDLPQRTVLITVTSVDGLRPVGESTWYDVPDTALPWVGAIAGLRDGRLVNVIDTRRFLVT